MPGIRESSAQTAMEYQTEPAVVAQVCQDVLRQIGKVTNVSRETGTISGKINVGWMENAAVIIRISKKGEGTELSIQTTKGEALFQFGSGAQRAITAFTNAMGQDKRLAGKSTGGW
jgi:hypothetical protein